MGQYLVNFLALFQGLRKTIVMVALMVIAVVLRIKGYISGDNLSDMLKNTTIAFFAGNSIEHVGSTIKEYINSKGQKKEETVVNVEETNAG